MTTDITTTLPIVHVLDGTFLGVIAEEDLDHAKKMARRQRDAGRSPQIIRVRTAESMRRLKAALEAEQIVIQEINTRRERVAALEAEIQAHLKRFTILPSDTHLDLLRREINEIRHAPKPAPVRW